jgi:hypothetical protein
MHRAKRHPEPRRGLAPRQAAPEDQLDHLALGWRQGRKRFADLAAQQGIVQPWLVRRERRELRFGRLAPPVLPAPPAQLVDRPVVRDRQQRTKTSCVTSSAAPESPSTRSATA